MKLLLFSDLHCDAAAAHRLAELAEGVDVLVGAGDFANAHRGISTTLDILRQTNKPAVLVPGNAETTEELTQACHNWPGAAVLHGTGVVIGDVPFFGIGGGIPVTPFGSWSYDFTEAQAAELLAPCPTGGVLVSHSPPHGAVDTSSRGQSLGSTAIRDAVRGCQPRLVVCGHIHGSAGQSARLGGSLVINAGPQGVLHELVNCGP